MEGSGYEGDLGSQPSPRSRVAGEGSLQSAWTSSSKTEVTGLIVLLQYTVQVVLEDKCYCSFIHARPFEEITEDNDD